jgi:signal peptidase I
MSLGREESQKIRRSSGFFRFLTIVAVAFLIITPFRFFVAQPFIVSGASMEPTLDKGEYLVIDELSYRFEKPARGDVVIFRYPLDPDIFFVKRLIGLPGETIKIREGDVYVVSDGAEIMLAEPYVPVALKTNESLLTTLGPNEYFVLGDNREASTDSRVWGPVRGEHIIGRAFLRLFPFNEMHMLPGEHSFAVEER